MHSWSVPHSASSSQASSVSSGASDMTSSTSSGKSMGSEPSTSFMHSLPASHRMKPPLQNQVPTDPLSVAHHAVVLPPENMRALTVVHSLYHFPSNSNGNLHIGCGRGAGSVAMGSTGVGSSSDSDDSAAGSGES